MSSLFGERKGATVRGVGAGLLLAWAAMAAAADPLTTASELIARGSVQQAAKTLNEHLRSNPQSADANRLLGIALALVPQRSAALDALERAVELGPDDPINHLAFGQVLARFGENDQAYEKFEAASNLDPSSAAAHEGLALSAALNGALEVAVRHFSNAIKHSAARDGARLHYLRGRAYSQLEQSEDAAADFKAAAKQDPHLGRAYLEWGRILAEAHDAEQTDVVLAKAVELLPDDFEARYMLGSHRMRTGQAASAVEHLRVAVRLDPNDRAAEYALGRALRAAGRTEEARELLARLAQADADRAVSDADINEAGRLNNEGLELEKRGAYEEALVKYRTATTIAPREIGFRRNAALALCRLNRWQEAKTELREVLRMEPGDINATKALYIALEHAPDDQ